MPRNLRATAAWRISIWTTLAFALGTAVAFYIVYFLVAQGIRERSDTWLSGEAEVLVQVLADTPRDHLHKRIIGEVAELATREVPEERNARGERLNSVFFLATDPNNSESPFWVGPGSTDAFVAAIQQAKLVPGTPKSIKVEGWKRTFRVVVQAQDGRTVYLGLSDRGAKYLLHILARRFLLIWGGMFLLGFVISYWSARRTLLRVERIAETVAQISTEDLQERLPEPATSDEISRLAKTFNHMLDRVQSSVNQLRTVTGAVAHDLKSPVTLIRGTLESALCDEGNDKWRDSVGLAIEELDRLLQLLNTTLDLAEAEAGALHMDRGPVDLSEVVRQLVDIYQPAMAERDQEVTVDLDPHVVIDADLPLMNRAVSNLLENELTHLPVGCRVSIRLHSTQGSAELVIEDNGPGFPPDMGSRAFERFVKGKHSPGHGLGLAFVDAVVHAHGGAARISDRAGGGAVITLSLPVSVLQVA
ncbi:MAG: ATP-binding protein [Terriglobales bacterium]